MSLPDRLALGSLTTVIGAPPGRSTYQLGAFFREEAHLRTAYNARRIFACRGVSTWERPNASPEWRYMVLISGVDHPGFFAASPDDAFALARAWVAGLENTRAVLGLEVAQPGAAEILREAAE